MVNHKHHHKPADYNRAFAIGVSLNVAFVAIEALFGILSNSLALLADSGHNLSDVLGLLLAWGASFLTKRKSTRNRTYGWRSSTIMAALINAVILMIAIGGIAWEAIRRFGSPAPVSGQTVIIVAAIGLIVNALTALLFVKGRKHDLNIRGAFLHMAADAGVSAGVLIGGLGIVFTGRQWIDPVVSLIIAAIILIGTLALFRDSFNLALHAVPSAIDPKGVQTYLANLPGVISVHDLHIWALSTTETALTAHLVKPDPKNDDEIISKATLEIQDRFDINHITIQWERGDGANCCTISCGDENNL